MRSRELKILGAQNQVLLADNLELKADNVSLKEANVRLKAENEELRGRLNANSRNSHQSPSSDGLRKQPALPRKRGGRKGGKKGHKGDTLKMSEEVDDIIPVKAQVCSCGQSLEGISGIVVERRQVFDLPQPKLKVTEYRRLLCECPKCKRPLSASFPATVNAATQYGPAVKALATLLSVRCCLSYEKISQFFEDVFGQPINAATIWSANQKAYEALEKPEAEIRGQLINCDVVHFDETGARVDGSLHWTHTASSERYTYLFIHKHRNGPALRSEYSVLPFFAGHAVHDCLSIYFTFTNCKHSACEAHLLRELAALEEQKKKWAKAFRQYLLLLYRLTDQGRGVLSAALRPWAERRYEELLAMARQQEPVAKKQRRRRGRLKGTKGYNLFKRLEKYKSAVLAFAYIRQVPFTNNQAERDLRPMKIKQKMAGCFRTLQGARIYARIQGFISTVQKHGLNVFNELRATFDGSPFSFALQAT